MASNPEPLKITALPASAMGIATSFLGPGARVYVSESVWLRIGTNPVTPDDASSTDLAWYAVLAASGAIGYSPRQVRGLSTSLVPVAFETGCFELRVTVLRECSGATCALISLPGEGILPQWVEEMMNFRN